MQHVVAATAGVLWTAVVGLLEWWLFPYSFLSLYFLAAEERDNKVRTTGLEPQGGPWS